MDHRFACPCTPQPIFSTPPDGVVPSNQQLSAASPPVASPATRASTSHDADAATSPGESPVSASAAAAVAAATARLPFSGFRPQLPPQPEADEVESQPSSSPTGAQADAAARSPWSEAPSHAPQSQERQTQGQGQGQEGVEQSPGSASRTADVSSAGTPSVFYGTPTSTATRGGNHPGGLAGDSRDGPAAAKTGAAVSRGSSMFALTPSPATMARSGVTATTAAATASPFAGGSPDGTGDATGAASPLVPSTGESAVAVPARQQLGDASGGGDDFATDATPSPTAPGTGTQPAPFNTPSSSVHHRLGSRVEQLSGRAAAATPAAAPDAHAQPRPRPPAVSTTPLPRDTDSSGAPGGGGAAPRHDAYVTPTARGGKATTATPTPTTDGNGNGDGNDDGNGVYGDRIIPLGQRGHSVTPLHFTPHRTGLDTPSLRYLHQKFAAGPRRYMYAPPGRQQGSGDGDGATHATDSGASPSPRAPKPVQRVTADHGKGAPLPPHPPPPPPPPLPPQLPSTATTGSMTVAGTARHFLQVPRHCRTMQFSTCVGQVGQSALPLRNNGPAPIRVTLAFAGANFHPPPPPGAVPGAGAGAAAPTVVLAPPRVLRVAPRELWMTPGGVATAVVEFEPAARGTYGGSLTLRVDVAPSPAHAPQQAMYALPVTGLAMAAQLPPPPPQVPPPAASVAAGTGTDSATATATATAATSNVAAAAAAGVDSDGGARPTASARGTRAAPASTVAQPADGDGVTGEQAAPALPTIGQRPRSPQRPPHHQQQPQQQPQQQQQQQQGAVGANAGPGSATGGVPRAGNAAASIALVCDCPVVAFGGCGVGSEARRSMKLRCVAAKPCVVQLRIAGAPQPPRGSTPEEIWGATGEGPAAGFSAAGGGSGGGGGDGGTHSFNGEGKGSWPMVVSPQLAWSEEMAQTRAPAEESAFSILVPQQVRVCVWLCGCVWAAAAGMCLVTALGLIVVVWVCGTVRHVAEQGGGGVAGIPPQDLGRHTVPPVAHRVLP